MLAHTAHAAPRSFESKARKHSNRIFYKRCAVDSDFTGPSAPLRPCGQFRSPIRFQVFFRNRFRGPASGRGGLGAEPPRNVPPRGGRLIVGCDVLICITLSGTLLIDGFSAMTTYVGRKRHDHFEVGVTVRLPTMLVNAVDAFADDELCLRSHAIRTLLMRGLKAAGRPLTREAGR
jgi:hypothetical protein